MDSIIKKKGKVALSERISLRDVFVNVTVTFNKETVTNEGTENEMVVGVIYPTEFVQVQFEADKLAEAGKVDVSALVSQAIEQLKEKQA